MSRSSPVHFTATSDILLFHYLINFSRIQSLFKKNLIKKRIPIKLILQVTKYPAVPFGARAVGWSLQRSVGLQFLFDKGCVLYASFFFWVFWSYRLADLISSRLYLVVYLSDAASSSSHVCAQDSAPVVHAKYGRGRVWSVEISG